MFRYVVSLDQQLETPEIAPGHTLKTLCLNWMRKLGIYSLTEAHGRAAKAHGRACGAGQCVRSGGVRVGHFLKWPTKGARSCTFVPKSARECVVEILISTVDAPAVLPGKPDQARSCMTGARSCVREVSCTVGALVVHERCRHFGTVVHP